jgi:hypothetical protein
MSTGMTALSAVQAAVMATLAADVTLMAAVPGGVWDYVPADPVWPYVCLDSADEVPEDSYSTQGRKVRLTFAIFSAYQGRAEQFAIVDHLVRLLRHTPLSLAGSPSILGGWDHIVTWHTGSQAISPFEAGNTRAGGSLVSFEVQVVESTP